MRKNKTLLFIVIMLIVISLLIAPKVYGAISGQMGLTSSANSSLKPGDEFTVTMSLTNISSSEGIAAIEGYINIDENVLEDLTLNSVVTNSDGKVEVNSQNLLSVIDANTAGVSSSDTGIYINTTPVGGKGDYRIVINFSTSLIAADTDIITITYKVKDGVATGTYEDVIDYDLFYIFSGIKERVALTSKSVDIIVKNETTNEDPSEDPTEDPEVTLDGITLNYESLNLVLGVTEKFVLISYPNPTDAALPTIVWTSSDEDVISLEEFDTNGAVYVVPNKAGTATVTATTVDGKYSVSCLITVNSNGDVSGNQTDDDNINNNTGSDTLGTTDNNSDGTDNTVSTESSLPNTGYKFIIIPGLVAVVAMGIIFYKKYRTYKDI